MINFNGILREMLLMIILKVTKYQDFNLSLEKTSFEKPQGVSNWYPKRVLLSVLGLKIISQSRCRIENCKCTYLLYILPVLVLIPPSKPYPSIFFLFVRVLMNLRSPLRKIKVQIIPACFTCLAITLQLI